MESSLPECQHYRHNGADVHCREDMITYHLQKHSSQWQRPLLQDSVTCLLPGQERMILDAIPKKIPWRLEKRKGNEGYGVQVDIRICYYKLSIGFILWAMLSAVFVAWWLKKRPGSLQDALAPGLLSLSLFLFYANLITGLRK